MSTYKRLPRDKKSSRPVHVATFLDHTYHWLENNWRIVLSGVVVILVIAASSLALKFYLGDRDDAAKALYFEATKAAPESEEALSKLGEVIVKYPKSGVADVSRIKLSKLYSAKGDFVKAEEVLTPATRSSSEILRTLAMNNLAELKLSSGKPAEAGDIYARSAADSKNPMRGSSYFNAALSYKEAGKINEAKKILEELSKEGTDYSTPELAEKSRQMLLFMASSGK